MSLEKSNLIKELIYNNNKMADNYYTGVTYYMLGVCFVDNAKKISSTLELKEDETPARYTAIPFYFLVSHAAELFLKAALLKRGYLEEDIKKFDYRHNLNALLKELQAKGVSVSPDTISLIDKLHNQHQTHRLRYDALRDDGKKVFWPPPKILFPMLDELLMLTRISTQGV